MQLALNAETHVSTHFSNACNLQQTCSKKMSLTKSPILTGLPKPSGDGANSCSQPQSIGRYGDDMSQLYLLIVEITNGHDERL